MRSRERSGPGRSVRRGRYRRRWRPRLIGCVCYGGRWNPDPARGVTTTRPVPPGVAAGRRGSCCSCSAFRWSPLRHPIGGMRPALRGRGLFATGLRRVVRRARSRPRPRFREPCVRSEGPGDLRPPRRLPGVATGAPRARFLRVFGHRIRRGRAPRFGLPAPRSGPEGPRLGACRRRRSSTSTIRTIRQRRMATSQRSAAALQGRSATRSDRDRRSLGSSAARGGSGFDARATLDASDPREAAAPERRHVSVGIGPPGCARPRSFDHETPPVLPPARQTRCSPLRSPVRLPGPSPKARPRDGRAEAPPPQGWLVRPVRMAIHPPHQAPRRVGAESTRGRLANEMSRARRQAVRCRHRGSPARARRTFVANGWQSEIPRSAR